MIRNQSIDHEDASRGEWACRECEFSLWIPIGRLVVSSLGLYDDARFPGRSILSLSKHYDFLEDVPEPLSTAFMLDIQRSATVLRSVTGAARVNVAILGNRDSHVHAHLIPRFPGEEPLPTNSPWDDTRPKTSLGTETIDRVVIAIQGALTR